MLKLPRNALLASVAFAVALPSAPLFAQAGESIASGTGAGDIIVTARKKDERLLDVPVAITALGGVDLARAGVSSFEELGRSLTQVRFEKVGGGGNGATFAIRGIGSASADKGVEQSVAINIDGVQSSRGKISVLSMFDVAQVEVLKGPQALYFGKNSPGGVVAIKSVNPGDRLEGYLRAGYEFGADERFVEAAVGGPISDSFGARLAVRGSKMDGWVKNDAQTLSGAGGAGPDPLATYRPNHDRFPGERNLLARLTLAWNPSDNFNANLKIFGADVKSNGEFGAYEVLCSAPFTSSVTLGFRDPYGDCALNGHTSVGAMPERYTDSWVGATADGRSEERTKAVFTTLSMNYTSDVIDIASVSGFYYFKSHGFDFYDGSIFSTNPGYTEERTKGLTQELRFTVPVADPLRTTFGAYFETQNRHSGGNGNGALTSLVPDPVGGFSNIWIRKEYASAKTYSLFGQLDWDISSELSLSGGARWTIEDRGLKAGNIGVNQAAFIAPGVPATAFMLPQGVFLRPRASYNNLSPEATLTYKPAPDLMLYASYRTGFKSGGLSSSSVLTASTTEENMKFKPEKAQGGEIGAKGEFFNRRLTLTTTAYRYEFDNLQSSSLDPGPPAAFRLRNAGKARTEGFELSANALVAQGFSLRGDIAYNHGTYLNFTTAPCHAGQTAAQGCGPTRTQDLSGHQLPYNPAWSGNAGFSYDVPVGGNFGIELGGSTSYTGANWVTTTETPLSRQQALWRFDGSIRLHNAADSWELSLIGRNLSNKRYIVYATDKPSGTGTDNMVLVLDGRPRQVLLQGTVRF